VGEVAISLCGNPARPESLLHTVRAVGAVTEAMSRLKRGAMLGVRGPFGNGWPLAEAEGKDVVIIAGQRRRRAFPTRERSARNAMIEPSDAAKDGESLA
jgi:NAD(P)H-flavin reductase